MLLKRQKGKGPFVEARKGSSIRVIGIISEEDSVRINTLRRNLLLIKEDGVFTMDPEFSGIIFADKPTGPSSVDVYLEWVH